MCGIIGVVGAESAADVAIKSLTRLTYRGYDSAGLVTVHDGRAHTLRRSGKIEALRDALADESCPGSTGIGHTRWATHGAPTEINAHPHPSPDGRFHVICNGIIENWRRLKSRLEQMGHTFNSETDTEVIPMLLQSYDLDSMQQAMTRLVNDIEGSFAIVVLDANNPNELWAARLGSPLLVAEGSGGAFLASDVPAILEYTDQVAYLDDGEMVRIEPGNIGFFTFDGKLVERSFETVSFSLEEAEKEGFEHFMLKEIYEQPVVVERTIKSLLGPEGLDLEAVLPKAKAAAFDEVVIVACGTAFHAGLVGGYLFEQLGLRAKCRLASEFHLFPPPMNERTLCLAVTQSGETIDTLYAMRKAAAAGATTLAICNVKGSTIVREADAAALMQAGPEIGVASTKAYSTMLAVLALLGPWIGSARGTLNETFDLDAYLDAVRAIPAAQQDVLDQFDHLKGLLGHFSHFTDFFYIARGYNLPTALEGALKLKEITYLHAEGYGAGEMKHGPIALVDKELLTIAIVPNDGLSQKMASNIEEIRARGGHVFLVASSDIEGLEEQADWIFKVPVTRPELTPLLTVLPLQFLAYEVAVIRGCDPDQPRNLAKSVTVE